MWVPVMTVRVMGVCMTHWRMDMHVGMRLGSIPRKIVLMPVVFVMGMGVHMLHKLMLVFVLMMFS